MAWEGSRMRKAIIYLLFLFAWLMPSSGWAKEVAFTLEDRDRLIQLEVTLKELKDSLDKRLEEFRDSVDKRFDQMEKRFEVFSNSVDKRFELMEKRLVEFSNSVDKRFDQVDKRFDQMMTFMWILASIFGSLVAVTIGFAIWDRRTALTPVLRHTRELERRDEKIERALRLLAESDSRVAEALRHVGLL